MMSISILIAVAGCGDKKHDGGTTTGSGSGSATATGAGSGSNSGSATGAGSGSATGAGSGSATGAGSGSGPATAVAVLGTGCPKDTSRVTDTPIKIDGAMLTFNRPRAAGCPTRPVYLAVYAKANPMPVTVCFDPAADLCEMYLASEPIAIDLTAALADAGATSAILAP